MKIQKEVKRSSVLGMLVALALGVSISAQAQITPSWNVTGNYTWLVLGTYAHDLSITVQNPDGTFSGTGGYPAGGPYQTTETISGQVVGSAITLTTVYAGPMNPGYTATATGTIASDGTMSGTSPWEWHTTSGAANFTSVPDWGTQLSAASCGKTGSLVINVNEKVVNDADSGFAGYWAMDSFVRHIQVWQVGKNPSTYCALVTYEGKADAAAGATGPAGSGIIGSGVTAIMKGGYRSTVFTGTLRTAPLWKTKGSVGTLDYNCNLAGVCSGSIDWVTQYFSTNAGYDLAWWGWFYDAGSHGAWLNSSEGSFGNIQ